MDVYLFTLCTGFGGLLLMALLGLGHHAPGGAHVHGHIHHGAAGAHHAAAVRPHQAPDHGGGGHHAPRLLALLSPRVIFSLLLGFGAAGMLLKPWVDDSWLLLAGLAAAGAAVFEGLLVRPLWKFLFRFASTPARMLDSTLLEESEAVTNFNADGHGLIALQLDGQVRHLLATLCAEDRAAGLRVRTGDRLFVRAVDSRRNRCTVAKLP